MLPITRGDRKAAVSAALKIIENARYELRQKHSPNMQPRVDELSKKAKKELDELKKLSKRFDEVIKLLAKKGLRFVSHTESAYLTTEEGKKISDQHHQMRTAKEKALRDLENRAHLLLVAPESELYTALAVLQKDIEKLLGE